MQFKWQCQVHSVVYGVKFGVCSVFAAGGVITVCTLLKTISVFISLQIQILLALLSFPHPQWSQMQKQCGKLLLHKRAEVRLIGVDLRQTKAEPIFDNIIVTDDVATASKFSAKWKASSKAEKARKKEEDDAKKVMEKIAKWRLQMKVA